MKKLNQWLATAALGVAVCSSGSFAETPVESFMARVQSQQFNTQVMTVPATLPSSVQMYLGKPANPINIDLIELFELPDFKIEMPGLNNLYAIKEYVNNNQLGGQSWVGNVFYLDPYGFETGVQGRAYFVERDGNITGTIHTQDEVIQIYPDGAGGQIVVSSDPAEFDEAEPIVDESAAAAPIIGGRIDGESPATLENPYTIDIMVVVPHELNPGITDVPGLIEIAMTAGNDTLANSQIPARLRLVETHYTHYDESHDDIGRSLGDLRGTNDGYMDEVHAIREQVGADMVMLVSNVRNPCGMGYLDATAATAFSATLPNCMTWYTPIHELGHNFGATHNTESGTNSNYSFGYGLYHDTTEPYWRTVMSYVCPEVSCPRIPYFSSAELMYNDIPLGDAETHDNARVLKVRVAEVAGFFPSEVAGCTEYTSTNDQHVSAGRAYTESSGGFFPTTTYRATGSAESMGNYGFTSSTLAEESLGYYTVGSCDSVGAGETAFAPEVQNLSTRVDPGLFSISGEVFDANSDDIASVEAKLESETEWNTARLYDGSFTVEIANASVGDLAVDIRTTDVTGESFTFTKSLTFTAGNLPIIQSNHVTVHDQDVRISMRSTNPEHPATVMFYQIDGEGDPQAGVWQPYPVTSSYWQVEIADLSVGTHTIHMYSLDADSQRSNVVTVSVTITSPVAPHCEILGSTASISGSAGTVEIWGAAEDANNSDVLIEYRINGSSWGTAGELARVYDRHLWQLILPQTYANDEVLTIEARATDSTGLQSLCGAITHTVTIPTGDEAPICEFKGIEKHEGYLRYYMMTSDANGNQQQMYAKESSQSEWMQTWPSTMVVGALPIPGFGEFTVQGRVIDSTGLEGLCERSVTIIDEGYTPTVGSVYGRYEDSLNTAVLDIYVEDFDGSHSVASAEYRVLGSSTWLAAAQIDGVHWQADLGPLTSGQYHYEVRGADTSGLVSDVSVASFTIDRVEAPVITSVEVTTAGQTANVSVVATDGNDDIDQLTIVLDGVDLQNYSNSNNGTWSINYSDLAVGTHDVEISVTDLAGNTSLVETRRFEVSAVQSCYTASNNEHVNEGRAYTNVVGETCFGTFCFGGATTYFANGSDDNMGASATATTSLNEVSAGYFEIGQCNVVDTTAPVITLSGNSPMNVSVGSTFIDPGATANDDIDGDISANIVVTGTVNTASVGAYTLTYNVSDAAGNAAQQVSRTVNVVEGSTCFETTLANHSSAGRAYEQYSLYYATGTAAYLGSTYADASKVVALEESSAGNWSEVNSCN
ncbi:MAG: DUF5011 domain-containing protein [Agarilytica sp.]